MSFGDLFIIGQGCPVIDVHGHLGPFHAIYMPEAPLDTMLAGMKRCGVERLVLSPHSALHGDTRQGNQEMLDAVAEYPGKIYGYCTLNPNFPDDIPGEMERCLSQPNVIGVKIHPESHQYPVGGKNYGFVWEAVNENKMMLLSHTWGAEGLCGAAEMRRIAEMYPDVRLLLGHSCYGAWDEAIAMAAEFPNVYDSDLLRLFSAAPQHHKREAAASFLRRISPEIRRAVSQWTGHYAYSLDQVLREVIGRCRELKLRVAAPPKKVKIDAIIMLTVITMNFLYSGRRRIAL